MDEQPKTRVSRRIVGPSSRHPGAKPREDVVRFVPGLSMYDAQRQRESLLARQRVVALSQNRLAIEAAADAAGCPQCTLLQCSHRTAEESARAIAAYEAACVRADEAYRQRKAEIERQAAQE